MKKKLLFLSLAIIVILLLMPRNVLLEMTTYRGDTWNESTLVAPFDIPLLKSNEQKDEDRKLIESSFEPIYTLDTENAVAITDPEIREIFCRGIIADDEVERAKSGSIRIVRGASMQHTAIESVPTVSKVAEMVQGKETMVIPASLKYNEQLSKGDYISLYNRISQTSGLIHEGETIVTEGQVIDESTQLRINSYLEEYKMRMGTNDWWFLTTIGRFVIILLTMIVNLIFFNRYVDKDIKDNFRKFTFMIGSYVVILAFFALLKWIRSGGATLPYVIPIAIIPILFLVLFDAKTAIIGNITICIISALFTQLPFEFFTVNILAGMTAILVLHNFYRRNELFKAVVLILAVEILTLFSFRLIEGYSFVSSESMKILIALCVNNLLLLGIYQMIYAIEKAFGFVSNITFVENSDTNQPLLLELSHKAPGTFQHSVQVANIAEAAAKLIGANALMVRCGALYHDIGKMKHPEYFIENTGGGINPHDECTPERSAEIIKAHVTDGMEIAQEHNLPECISRFISTHHGNSVISYFYHKALDTDPATEKSNFCYPGENPKTKEECICMMCDTIEAASRSLKSYDKKSIDDLVETLVGKQIENGHFSQSELTFSEVTSIKELLKEQLHNIYHVRIAYPK